MGAVIEAVNDAGITTLVEVQDLAFSTTTPLGSAGVYTSGFVTNLRGRRISGSVYSDQTGSFVIQGSDDGTHWVALGASTPVTAATLTTFDQVLYTALTRIVYTNGGVAQGTFRLYGYISPFAA